jgi:hypothetical protein
MFTTLTQFLSYAKAQNSVIAKYEGIIFYYDTDSIPQDVFCFLVKLIVKPIFQIL